MKSVVGKASSGKAKRTQAVEQETHYCISCSALLFAVAWFVLGFLVLKKCQFAGFL